MNRDARVKSDANARGWPRPEARDAQRDVVVWEERPEHEARAWGSHARAGHPRYKRYALAMHLLFGSYL
jgi:hypothetical protein